MRFNPESDKNVRTIYNSWNTINDGRWTKLLSGFLKSMGSSLGYVVSPERPSFGGPSSGGGRFDMKWRGKDREVVLIEYENDSTGVEKNEIPKLLTASGNLRILISYVSAARFPGEELASRILRILNSDKRGDNFEFLLILGTWDMKQPTDWIGWQFCPTFEMKPLILPYLKATSGVRAALARKGRGRDGSS